MAISFHSEVVPFVLPQKNLHKRWIRKVIHRHGKLPGEIQYIFTSNDYLLVINRKYLNHDHYTDVITFDYGEGKKISGDVFISVEQVEINAEYYGTVEADEMRRVMIHGILHLLGYKDEQEDEKRRMREMEDEALNLWQKGEKHDFIV